MKKRSTKAQKMPTGNQLARAELRRNGYTRPNGGKEEQIRGNYRKTKSA